MNIILHYIKVLLRKRRGNRHLLTWVLTALLFIMSTYVLTITLLDLHGNEGQPVQDQDYYAETETRNIVYVKMIKCASETLTSIFRRFGYSRNLSFVLPLDRKLYLGWPYQLEDSFYRPSKTGEFNIACDHVMYNRTRFRAIMPDDTVYITSLREPYSQFKSMFHYYNLKGVTNMSVGINDPIREYLTHIDHYEKLYKAASSSKLRYCIPDELSMSKNLMSFNLGFRTGSFTGTPDDSLNIRVIQNFLREIESRFILVIIVEYFDESLVLLRRLLNWSHRDILYVSRNYGVYKYKRETSPDLVAIYRKWSKVDYKLYDHFNKTLWRKIKRQGDDFWDEVAYFRYLKDNVATFCDEQSEDLDRFLRFRCCPWGSSGFIVNPKLCHLLDPSLNLLELIKKQYDDINATVPSVKPSKNFC